MNFQCEYCLKIFKKKHHYIQHLNRKKKCNEIIELGNGGISRIVAYKELMNNFK